MQMRDDASKFRKSYEVQRREQANSGNNRKINYTRRNDKIVEFPERYTAPKGTARRAKERKKRNRLKLRIASLLLAAGIGLGGLSIVGRLNNEPEPNITQMQEMGVSRDELNLENDTLEMMEKYDEYFESFNPKTANLTDNDVIAMIEDIRMLNFNVIKDKMAELRGVTRDDVKLYYSFIKGDGEYHTSVRIHGGEYGKEEIYNNDYGILFGLGKEDTIPKEVSNLIVQLGRYDPIVSDLKADTVTKANAIKRLEKLYREISEIATKDFSMGDNGNIELKEYDVEKDKTANKEENER